MNWVFVEIKERRILAPLQQPLYLFFSPPPPPPPPPPPIPSSQSSGFNLNNKVSPSVFLIIIILAIIFFISGVLHLLLRLLLRPANRDTDEIDNVTVLQGQLQQLFHLHDAGVDQSFIDTLPIFNYKSIIGLKDPFDCAVCLCEFEFEDKLRLLPKCSHAFHVHCIDTWLLSHSTCPLCRASLLNDFSPNPICSPMVLVLESGGESSREGFSDQVGLMLGRTSSHLSCGDGDDLRVDLVPKSCEIENRQDEGFKVEKVVQVKLGKFKNVDGGSEEGCSDGGNVDARRCFSMGSFAYVMDEGSSLQVPIRTPLKKPSTKKLSLPLTPGHRPAMSECGGCHSRREFNGLEAFKILEIQSGCDGSGNENSKSIGRGKKESFSVSKIWLRGKKDRPSGSTLGTSRRAFSFRFPVVVSDEIKGKNGGCGAVSEIDICMRESGRSDEDDGSCNSLDSQVNAPSFARRTLIWLMGKPNKVIHTSSSSNV